MGKSAESRSWREIAKVISIVSTVLVTSCGGRSQPTTTFPDRVWVVTERGIPELQHYYLEPAGQDAGLELWLYDRPGSYCLSLAGRDASSDPNSWAVYVEAGPPVHVQNREWTPLRREEKR